jgi:hypothetical protein
VEAVKCALGSHAGAGRKPANTGRKGRCEGEYGSHQNPAKCPRAAPGGLADNAPYADCHGNAGEGHNGDRPCRENREKRGLAVCSMTPRGGDRKSDQVASEPQPVAPIYVAMIEWGRELNELTPEGRDEMRARVIARTDRDPSRRYLAKSMCDVLDSLANGWDAERYFIGAASRNQERNATVTDS